VSPDLLFNLGIAMGPVMVLFLIVPYFFARRVKTSRVRHEEIQQALNRRREALEAEMAQ
jgi:Na+/melibiose symporter-like transporter|tara:strand:+ start:1714 stop:1890 length:177 start_codon:yes stop_codon:yes gene_type:complete